MSGYDATVRVAVATSDGSAVDRHFGHAQRFDVYRAGGQEPPVFERTIEVEGCCKHPGHDTSRLRETVQALAEACDILICEAIGPGALDVAQGEGLECYEFDGPVADAIDRILAYRKVEALIAGF